MLQSSLPRRLLAAALLSVAILGVNGATAQQRQDPSQTQVAGTEQICVEDRSDALQHALIRHGLVAQYIRETKGVEPPPEGAFRDAQEFQLKVLEYLGAVPDSSLILYAVDDDFLCAFLWTQNTARNHEFAYARTPNQKQLLIEPAKDLAAAIVGRVASRDAAVAARVERMRKGEVSDIYLRLSQGRIGNPDAIEAEVSKLLFPESFRTALARTKHLSMIPVGAISSMPISVLKPLGTSERVVDRFSVNILLFADQLKNPAHQWTPRLQKALVMGNPGGSDVFWSEEKIPQSEIEAQYAASKFGARAFVGPKATTLTFIRQAPDAELIYLATHGVAGYGEGRDPLRDSYVILSDNRLPATTIRDFGRGGLKAKLVVLSACQTGLGRVTEGGVIGLARTFLDSGADNVLMTTWNVDDTATMELMKAFIDHLPDHQPSEALRLAQLSIMKTFPDPLYWSAFNVFGNQFSLR